MAAAMAAATSFSLQEPSLIWKNQLYHSPRSPALSSVAHFTNHRNFRFRKLSVKCSLTNKRSSSNNDYTSVIKKIGFVETEIKKSPIEIVANSLVDALKALRKPVAAALLVGLLLMYDPNSALAASGGRMGGSSFSSRASTSSSSSRSYSAPRMAEGSGFSYSEPYDAPSPFGGGFFGPCSASTSSSSSRSYSAPRMAAGSGFSYSEPYDAPSPLDGGVWVFDLAVGFVCSFFLIVLGFLFLSGVLTETEETSVLKLQVGLLGLGRSLQKDLNRIAETADTSTPKGLHYVLTETVLALLRHPDYCISAYSSVDVKRSPEEGEKKFNQLSIEERGKFDEETLVNFNDIKKQSSTILRASGFSNEYIVITILVAAEGAHKLPSINNSKGLKDGLQKLASIPASRIMAVEVLWTPQNEDDTLSERELLGDYPLLRPL